MVGFFSFLPYLTSLLTLSFDLDLRYQNDFQTSKFIVSGLGVSLRQTFSDPQGDRFLTFLFLDWQKNFKNLHLVQFYFTYKGPMGLWRVSGGRYIIPFGLLPNYSTERLLVSTLASKVLGSDVDNGILFSLLFHQFDYHLSLSQGTGMEFLRRVGPLFASRLGYRSEDEEKGFGLAYLFGKRVMADSQMAKKFLAFDGERYFGRLIGRGEGIFGFEEREFSFGFFSAIDYSFRGGLDFNLGLLYWQREGSVTSLTFGFTNSFNLSSFAIAIRLAYRFSFSGGGDEFIAQVYNYFGRTL